MIGNCEVTGQKGQFSMTPAVPGQLTVEVNLPAPGCWNGDTPDTIQDGFEYCMAANIAHRLGLDKVGVVNVAWDALVAGQTKNYDLALSQASITEERKKVVDFSVPYFSSDVGVLVKKGTESTRPRSRPSADRRAAGDHWRNFRRRKAQARAAGQSVPRHALDVHGTMANQVDVAMTDTAIVLSQAANSNRPVRGRRPVRHRRELRRHLPQGLGQQRRRSTR